MERNRFRQKINHHFYFPAITDRTHLNPEKMSLIDVVMESFQSDMSYRVFKSRTEQKQVMSLNMENLPCRKNYLLERMMI